MMVVTSPRLSAFVLGGDPDHRVAALRLRPRGAPPLAVGAGYACRCFGLCGRTDRRGARAASLHQRAARHQPFSRRRRARLSRPRAIRSVARASSPALLFFLSPRASSSCSGSARRRCSAAQMTPGRLGQFILYAVLCGRARLGSLSEIGGEVAQASGAAERLFEILADQARDCAPGTSARAAVACARRGRFRRRAFLLSDAAERVGARWRFVSRRGRARRSRSSALPAPARARSFICCCASTIPPPGRITFDGVRLADLDPADLRARIALVPQDSVMFATSVADNIRFGRPDASDAEVARAAEHAHAASFHRGAAGRDGNAGRRARRYALGRPAAADSHRPRDVARRAAIVARRGDIVARLPKAKRRSPPRSPN